MTVPRATYLAFFALTWIGVLGWIAGRSRLPANALRSRALHGYLFAAFGATLAAHVALNFAVVSVQGRQLFAAAPQAAFLLALGIYRLIGSERRLLRSRSRSSPLLLALDVYCLRGVLIAGVLGAGAGLVAHRFGRRLRRATSCASASASSRVESAPSR